MRPQDFKRWRKTQHLSQKQAAEALGLKRRVVQYYEKGERDGEKVKIPRTVRLACAALANGLAEWKPPVAAKPTPKPKAEKPKAAKAEKAKSAKPEKPKAAKPKSGGKTKAPKPKVAKAKAA